MKTRSSKITLLFSLFFLCFSLRAIASDLTIPYLSNSVGIDGQFSLEEWQGAATVELNYVTRPFENAPAPTETEVYFFEDGDTLYVAFIAHDPSPIDIRAFLSDRDKIFSDDTVGIKLDPYQDGRLAYQFFSNPLGVQGDAIENQMTGNESTSWNGIWQSAGRLTETGFVVEMAIPLRLMNFVESNGKKTWGVEFVRFYPRKDFYRISHVTFDRNNACALCQMGKLKGFENAKQSENLAVVPTLVLGSGRVKDPTGDNTWAYDSNQEVGVDVNWSISPELTFSGTLNPDFSQVEADQAQLSINRTFALFFEERRPFFVENAEYFSSNQNLIYTRNINAPRYGAKITGRLDNHSLGVFVADDDSTTFVMPGNLGSQIAFLDQKSTNFAGRYRYDYSNNLSFGLLSTIRTADDYSNIVTTADVRYLITPQDTFRVQVNRSQTEYPEFLYQDFCSNDCSKASDLSEAGLRSLKDDTFSGLSYRFMYDRATRDYFFRARRIVDEANFRADLGFVNGIDRKRWTLGGGYHWFNEDSWWNRFTIYSDWDITHNQNGELIERELEGEVNLSAAMQSFFLLGFEKRLRVGLREYDDMMDDDLANMEIADITEQHIEELLAIDGNTQQFDESAVKAFFKIRPNAMFQFETFWRKGDRIDFANSRLGEQFFTENEITLNLGTHFKLDFEHTYSQLDADNQRVFIANLYDTRMTYQFDPFQFVRLIVAYSDVSRNQENYLFSEVDEESKSLGFQLLYSYKVNPLTKFFVGYSQSAFDNDSLNSLRTNSQSVFMKFSYAWLP